MSLSSEQRRQLWQRLATHRTDYPNLHLSVDLTRVDFPEDLCSRQKELIDRAFRDMDALEKGAIANPDENRMVGHYWLRAPELAPTPEITQAIRDCQDRIKEFVAQVHAGEIRGQDGPFEHFLLIGIGGSALGPQFVAHALGHPKTDRMRPHFFDNTDPDGMDRVLAELEGRLGRTLVVVISKSGGTKETANGMKEAQAAYRRAGLDFAAHAVAVTGEGSELDRLAADEKWLRRFPMWEWVGGRTSETSAVGLLPAALQGVDTDALLAGAAACDTVTRVADVRRNPAMQLALTWHFLGDGHGSRDMVLLPYKDRLELFSRYLQQLVMESLGKELDLDGRTVHQGLTVYGNKGSTDQHAFVQQLRDGPNNFFVVFIEVLRDRAGASIEVEPQVTSGDYLDSFLLGTRDALYEKDRQSVTLTIEELSPFTLGVLIALFERAVGLYASMIHINAYHQPGVQAGKLAANAVLELQRKVLGFLKGWRPDGPHPKPTAAVIAEAIGEPDAAELVLKICEHLSRNPGRGVRCEP
ncbi:MAG: glucose-6-phosphate isomerase, partial [Verrucomicrobia bacterium]